jgi:hypothetical protein
MQIRLVSQVHFILRSCKAHIFLMLKILLFQVLSIDDILVITDKQSKQTN